MRSTIRGTLLAAVGTLTAAVPAWAHPGHVTEESLRQTVVHTLSSPYHVAVIVAAVVLALAWTLAVRPARAARRSAGQAP